MKKVFCVFMIMFLLSGCSFKKEKNIVNKLENKINNLESYNLKGDLEIFNGEDTYNYKLDVSYKKDNLFKVSLTNSVNNHQQIILKNKDGVFVVTPSLNKSFKFQSDWPYNNSQIYLWQTILNDIKNDKNYTIEKDNDINIIKSKVNYTNNEQFVSQKVYVDKDNNIIKVEILNSNNDTLMRVKFNKIDLKPTFDDNYFGVNTLENSAITNDSSEAVFKIDTIIYPMYIPLNTHLVSQNKLSFSDGERVLMNFDGDSPFMLIQETVNPSESLNITPMYGDPILIGNSIGAFTDTSITWIDNDIEYYLTSEKINSNELINIAESINLISVGK